MSGDAVHSVERGTKRACGTAGFTYIGLLITIVIISISTAVVAKSWKVTMKVEREKELLWIGNQFRQAIGRYYEALDVPSHAGLRLYPKELKDLLQDPRSPGTHRYLRKIYADPMTGKDDWVLMMDDKNHIKGVHSKSDVETLKRDGFDLADESFAGKTRYSEWVFEYVPLNPDPGTQPPGNVFQNVT
ncbi:MAG: type II secretion system protein [Nitrospirae bacterium]|nr:type II secretion system protein [Nitrospirota bacterium]MBI5695038.1 type II secretion system protein [Nitrospirota bacterium]